MWGFSIYTDTSLRVFYINISLQVVQSKTEVPWSPSCRIESGFALLVFNPKMLFFFSVPSGTRDEIPPERSIFLSFLTLGSGRWSAKLMGFG